MNATSEITMDHLAARVDACERCQAEHRMVLQEMEGRLLAMHSAIDALRSEWAGQRAVWETRDELIAERFTSMSETLGRLTTGD